MMERILFAETQVFRDNRWVVALVIAIFLAAMLPLASGLYWQLVKDMPWGDKPLSDNGMIVLFVSVFISSALGAAAVLVMRLDVQITAREIRYKMIPVLWRWHTVSKDQISNYSVEKKFRSLSGGMLSYGYHLNLLNGTRSMRIRGGNHLALTLKTGQRLLLGTQDPGGLERALKKMMTIKETM